MGYLFNAKLFILVVQGYKLKHIYHKNVSKGKVKIIIKKFATDIVQVIIVFHYTVCFSDCTKGN